MKVVRLMFRKPRWSTMLPLALGVGLVVSLAMTRQPSYEDSQLRQIAPPARSRGDVAVMVDSLSQKWMEQFESQDWLFFSYKDEITGPVGNNPETGQPLANEAFWELWYELDESGNAVTVLVRHTDLERGTVTRVAWHAETLLREPSGTMESGHDWAGNHPIKDHFCNKSVLELRPSATVKESWWIDGDGVSHRVTQVRAGHSSITTADITGKEQEYIGTELTCSRNESTGAVDYSSLAFLPSLGEPIVYQRTYEYVADSVAQPPSEMMDLLDELLRRLSER